MGVILPEITSAGLESERIHLDLRFSLEAIRDEIAFDETVTDVETTTRGPYRTTVAFFKSPRAPAAEVLMRLPFHRRERVRFIGEGWNSNNNVTTGPNGPIARRDDEALHVDFVQLVSYRYEFAPSAIRGPSLPRVAVTHEVSMGELWPTLTLRNALETHNLPNP
jgi:hypothetical protein